MLGIIYFNIRKFADEFAKLLHWSWLGNNFIKAAQMNPSKRKFKSKI